MDLKTFCPPPPSPVPRDLLDEATTLTDALTALVDGFPDFECLTVLDRHGTETRLSFGAVWTRARQIQAALVTRGVEPGRCVLLVLRTGPELAAAYFGAVLVGAIPALVAPPSNRFADPAAYATRLRGLLAYADAQALYCDDEVAALVGPGLHAAGRTRVMVPTDVEATRSWPAVVRPVPDAIVSAQFSSGTTGTPKGVLLSHRAILNNIRATRDGLALEPGDVCVNWLPLYHDMGLIDAFLLPVLGGSSAVLIPTLDFLRDPALWLWAIHHYRGTVSLAPNFGYALCAQRIADADLIGLDLASWRIALSASEPVLPPTVEAFTRRFATYGLRPEAPTPGWGLAESVCVATVHPLAEPPRIETLDRHALAGEHVARVTTGEGFSLVAVGKALPGAELQVRDGDGRPVQDRHVGAVWVRASFLFSGYHRDPEATARTLVDGWLDTGDRGYLVEGHLFFVSREKDLIVIGGEKYAPHDVETAINAVPGVRAGCAVAFGVLNPERGTEDLGAVVETRETDEAVLARLRDAIRAEVTRVTGLGLRHVLLVPPGGVEKTTSGKLARRATQRRYVAELGST